MDQIAISFTPEDGGDLIPNVDHELVAGPRRNARGHVEIVVKRSLRVFLRYYQGGARITIKSPSHGINIVDGLVVDPPGSDGETVHMTIVSTSV